MSYPPHIWSQLKNLTKKELKNALEKDGWARDVKRGAILVYRHPDGRRVTVHYHSGKTFGPKLLKSLLADIGWDEIDLANLKLIK